MPNLIAWTPGTRGTASSDVAGRQSKSKDFSDAGFQFELPFESFRPPPGLEPIKLLFLVADVSAK